MTLWPKILQKVADLFPVKVIGWTEIGETFHRYTLFRCPFFKIYLHRVNCPVVPPKCHDHPWHFVTLILSKGYMEEAKGKVKKRNPGTVLYRPARFAHKVWTDGDAWSVIVASKRVREWGHIGCEA